MSCAYGHVSSNFLLSEEVAQSPLQRALQCPSNHHVSTSQQGTANPAQRMLWPLPPSALSHQDILIAPSLSNAGFPAPLKASSLTILLTGPLNPNSQRRRSHNSPRLEQNPRRHRLLRLPPQIRRPHQGNITRENQWPERSHWCTSQQGRYYQVED